MSIYVSEPGRPIETRLPESLRARRVGAVGNAAEAQKTNASRNEATAPALLNAEQVTARRAFAKYSQTSESDPETERPYLPASRICSRSLHTLPASALMSEALTSMDEYGVHHLVITAEDSVAGLIDYRWLLGWLHEEKVAPERQSFTQVELPAFLTASPETDAHQLARLMLAHQLDAALVIDQNGAPVGIVTGTDYLRLYAGAGRQQSSV